MYPLLTICRAALKQNVLRRGNPAAASIRWNASLSSNTEYKVGDIIHGYKLEKVDHIKELNIRPYYLRHEATGAEHLHIHKEGDSNNVFAVSLRTTPKNSTGVAHILEHLALCGSKKYAVRDPFFKMLTRSLATFMNAMTGPDFTVYPFSTQNAKDFEHLLSVYTDAVFFPRLRPVDFRQEGWRLEHEKPSDQETPIVLRGVVYNEMKGAFSSSSTIYSRQLLNNLFPDTTYRYESGGDPENIPSLSHSELKKFHQLHYHPSNAKFYTYGDIPMDRHLKLINEMVMTKFSENSQAREQSCVQEQEPWKAPRVAEITGPSDPMSVSPDKQTTTSISYMLPTKITNLDDIFSLQILSELLISGPNAPFYKNLVESGIGSGYSPASGLECGTKQPCFSIGLENIKTQDVSRVHEIIEKTFTDTAAEGFKQERVDAILHDIELGTKHVSGSFGLRALMNLGSAWNHDTDIIESMKINNNVEKFKKAIKDDKDYWSNMIKKHFLANNHKLILTMTPDADFETKRKEREKDLLESKISKLNDVDKKTILYEGMELLKIQNSKDDVSILPCLDPSKDISRELAYRTGLKFDSHQGVDMQLCEQPTNEVVYFRGISDISEKLSDNDLIDYLPIFCDVATKLGAGSYNRHEFAQKIQLTTGGLGVSLLINPSLSEFDSFKVSVLFGSQCLTRNVSNMFDLWQQVFKQIHLQENEEYLKQLIERSAAGMAAGVSHYGNSYAAKRAASSLSKISALDERLSGLSYIARVKDMASKESIDTIVSRMRYIANIVFDPHHMRCAINAEPNVLDRTTDQVRQFVDTLQKSHKPELVNEVDIVKDDYEKTSVNEMKFPFATHYVAKSMVTVPLLHEDFPKLVIMSQLISSKYLLREVREKGGAYGSKASLARSGILSFSSYRDPNTSSTMKTFDCASRWIKDATEYSDKDIEESKLGVFQSVDMPIEPGKRGLNHFIYGETDDIREKYRKQLLDVSESDVMHVADKYLNQATVGTHII